MMNVKHLSMLLLLLSTIFPVDAKDLYRWQDENGQWHFGDSASASLKPHVDVVTTPPETANFIKTKIVKLPVKKAAKTSKSTNLTKRVPSSSRVDQQQQCDKLRDSLRFKAFRYEERDYYDRECISKVKW
ncbi:MAG: DUF4124 domain-containing protein [Agitococcus sp.]|nr:DUF4124 domain-containing protein [Agitococcus sp.]